MARGGACPRKVGTLSLSDITRGLFLLHMPLERRLSIDQVFSFLFCSHLVPIVFSWALLVSPGLFCSLLVPIVFSWSHLDSYGLFCSHLVLPLFLLVSTSLTWSLLLSPCPSWSYQVSSVLSSFHLVSPGLCCSMSLQEELEVKVCGVAQVKCTGRSRWTRKTPTMTRLR